MDKDPKNIHSWPARRLGYIVTIIILFGFFYVFLHLYDWNVPFLTESYNDVLWYIRLSFYSSIIAHAVFLVYDPAWFRHLLKAMTNIFFALMTIMFYVIFPFNFPTDQLNKIVKIILLVMMILSLISILTELVTAIRSATKNNQSDKQ
ncbi:MAG: hypothetical protein PHD61_10295 [Bacteroidales bacterium]|nr:hypothetical protein [Lentimicrobiaceae bacterium]MDD5695675.1 hypothetical protein [Bacteroidales bacterium]